MVRAVKIEQCNKSGVKKICLSGTTYVRERVSCENVLFFVRRLGKSRMVEL